MKNILLILLLGLSSVVQAQKQSWSHAELIDGNGETIHKWEAQSFTQLITQRVCAKNFLVISSEDPKVMQMISPSSVFDVSPMRTFEQFGEIEKADRDSTQIIYKIKFKTLNYPDEVLLFTDSIKSFMMLMPNRTIALVLYNGKNK
tara:strand:- start:1229 stop:1666 length:438 start_codon:yes stop_codon:yes gene_type:complete